jgi:hypothetical protein
MFGRRKSEDQTGLRLSTKIIEDETSISPLFHLTPLKSQLLIYNNLLEP